MSPSFGLRCCLMVYLWRMIPQRFYYRSFRILSHSALLNSWIFLGLFALMVAFSDASTITRWSWSLTPGPVVLLPTRPGCVVNSRSRVFAPLVGSWTSWCKLWWLDISRSWSQWATSCPAGTLTLNPRWIHVMAWRCFHVDIWFYLKIESTSGFPRWFHVMFSTLIPRVFHVESTCFQRWINVMFSTLNQRQDPHVVSTLIFGSIWKLIPCPVFNVEST